MRLLLIEDDKSLGWTIKSSLDKQHGYVMDWVTNGLEGVEMAEAYEYDLILLDIMLPGQDGFAACRSIRNTGNKTPILMLTARSREDDRVRGLDLGADDYLVKPFSYPELFARIRALIRRAGNQYDSVITAGLLVMDTAARKVVYDGKQIELTAREYAVLEYLSLNKGNVVTREMLEHQLWDCESGAFSNVIEVMICHIRRKLCPSGERETVVKTVKGLGYVIRDS
ncbi:MAG: response regulator transcription factor [Dehalogenimonas sp.]|uniref:Response regulator transcription factor n=1 Tax=Candidatus Dehalogenimonas loeffleri TaxID=3127115 RepID=A0ABZ2J9T7_9CHLR|nr:response regulator transcription factor [Dehalogenimonas sp.]